MNDGNRWWTLLITRWIYLNCGILTLPCFLTNRYLLISTIATTQPPLPSLPLDNEAFEDKKNIALAVSSLASLAHGQLDEKEPFLTVHEPETESSFTHTGNISSLNNMSTVFLSLGWGSQERATVGPQGPFFSLGTFPTGSISWPIDMLHLLADSARLRGQAPNEPW